MPGTFSFVANDYEKKKKKRKDYSFFNIYIYIKTLSPDNKHLEFSIHP